MTTAELVTTQVMKTDNDNATTTTIHVTITITTVISRHKHTQLIVLSNL